MPEEQLGICDQFSESQSQADYEKNIIQFAEQDYDLVIVQSNVKLVGYFEAPDA